MCSLETTRREFLQLLSWTLAAPVFVGKPRHAMAGSPTSTDFEQQVSAALDYFEKQGYIQLPAMDLITGGPFNDGLRFDDTPPSYPPGQAIRIQDCVRIEDLSKKGQVEVLPYFHIFSFSIERPAHRGQLLSQLLDYLITRARLNPAKMALVSTDGFEHYLPLLEPLGIDAEQYVQRDRKAAMAKGDGSGYFKPPGHPYAVGQHTVSIHYARKPDTMGQALKYPLPGYLEIAEVAIDPSLDESLSHEGGGFGIERLMLAQGQVIESFAASRQRALVAIEAEAKRCGVALPKGYQMILNS